MVLVDSLRFWLAKRRFLSLKKMPIKSIMTDYLVVIRPDASIVAAATKMIAENVACLIVHDGRKPFGIITQRDFLLKVAASPRAIKLKVSDLMSKNLITLNVEESFNNAVNTLISKGIRKLIVEDGSPMGFLTQTDIVKEFSKLNAVFTDKPGVSDWLSKKLISAPINTPFSKAKSIMKSHNVGALPIKKGNEFVGIMTESDVISQFYDSGGMITIKSISEIMSKRIYSISYSESWMTANKVMLQLGVRRLLVIRKGKVEGIITQTDITKAIHHSLNSDCKTPETVNSNLSSKYLTDHIKLFYTDRVATEFS